MSSSSGFDPDADRKLVREHVQQAYERVHAQTASLQRFALFFGRDPHVVLEEYPFVPALHQTYVRDLQARHREAMHIIDRYFDRQVALSSSTTFKVNDFTLEGAIEFLETRKRELERTLESAIENKDTAIGHFASVCAEIESAADVEDVFKQERHATAAMDKAVEQFVK